jgi:hypothetical protein
MAHFYGFKGELPEFFDQGVGIFETDTGLWEAGTNPIEESSETFRSFRRSCQ